MSASRVASGVSVVVDDDEEDDDLVKPDWKALLDTALYDSLYDIGIQGGCDDSDCLRTQTRSDTSTMCWRDHGPARVLFIPMGVHRV